MLWSVVGNHPVELLPEASAVLLRRLASAELPFNKLDALMRSVRASMVAKKPETLAEIYGSSTNCLGNIYWLGKLAERFELELEPTLVLRYPWQEVEACREINMVAALTDIESGTAIVADPAPASGYSHGTTRAGRLSGSTITIFDEVLGGEAVYALLSEETFQAIAAVTEAETVQDPAEAIAKLQWAYERLGDAQSFRVRALQKLSLHELQKDEALRLLARESTHAFRRSYASLLPSAMSEEVLVLRVAQVRSQQGMLSPVSQAIANAKTVDERNYWLSVQRVFHGETETDAPAKDLSPRSFLERGSWDPIWDYEGYVTIRYPAYAKSNLYTCDWDMRFRA